MKSLYAFALSSVVLAATVPAAMANADTKKEMRNDRIYIKQGIAQYDINPFVDRKRAERNDRVSYVLPKGEVNRENKTVNKQRIIRNDRVILTKSVGIS